MTCDPDPTSEPSGPLQRTSGDSSVQHKDVVNCRAHGDGGKQQPSLRPHLWFRDLLSRGLPLLQLRNALLGDSVVNQQPSKGLNLPRLPLCHNLLNLSNHRRDEQLLSHSAIRTCQHLSRSALRPRLNRSNLLVGPLE